MLIIASFLFFLDGKSACAKLLAGWDGTVDPVYTNRMTANIVTPGFEESIMNWFPGAGWERDARGSVDETFGSFPGAFRSTDLDSGAFRNNQAMIDLYVDYTVVNNEAHAWFLDSFNFDVWRSYAGARESFTLSIVGGDLALTNDFATGSFLLMGTAWTNADYQDVDVSLSDLQDRELLPGESVTFRLSLIDDNIYSANCFIDNVGVFGTKNTETNMNLGLWGTEDGETSADFSWRPVVNASGYKVFRDDVLLGTVTVPFYNDSGLDKYASYEYTIIPVNSFAQELSPSGTFIYAYRRYPFVMPWDDSLSNSVANVTSVSSDPARVTVSNGRLTASGEPFRFFGINLSLLPPKNDALYGDVAEKMAARLASLGVKCVRIHVDRLAEDGGLFETDWVTLNPVQLDLYDYFVARLKAHGIYTYINLHVIRKYPGYSTENFGSVHFKAVDLYMPELITYQKEFSETFLTHTNIYTGMTYAEDPSIAFVEINNENGLIDQWRLGLFSAGIDAGYLGELELQWNDWLSEKYITNAALAAAWVPDSAGQDYGKELVANGTFLGTDISPWQVQVSSPAAATWQVVSNGAPDGSNALEIDVDTAVGDAWRVQAYYSGLSVTAGQSYTVSFWGRSETPRSATIRLFRAASPYGALSSSSVIHLDSQWRKYTTVITATETENYARIDLTGLATQTGVVSIAHFSTQTGNLLQGPQWSLPEGVQGEELFVNGDFSSGLALPWLTKVTSPAVAEFSVVNDILQVDVATASPASPWTIEFSQLNVPITNQVPYTLTFRAMSDVSRNISVRFGRIVSPWDTVSDSISVQVDNTWRTYTVILRPTETISNARLNIADLATQTGTIWFDDFSLTQGIPAGIGLPDGEVLGSISILADWNDLMSRTRTVKKDWMAFLWDTEVAYWTDMRDYLANDLDVEALVIGTQTQFSPSPIQAKLDVVDTHIYWQHPIFTEGPWNENHWYFNNLSMAGNGNGQSFSRYAVTRVPGKPFICSEYNHCFPNTYSAETFLLSSAYASFQGWDGLCGFNYLHKKTWAQGFSDLWFQIALEPGKLITLPPASSVLHNELVSAGDNMATAVVTMDDLYVSLLAGDWPVGAQGFGLDRSVALLNPVGIDTGSVALVSSPLTDLQGSIWTNNTGEIVWNNSTNLMIVDSAGIKALIGKTWQQSYPFNDGVSITPGATMQDGDWVVISLARMDGDGFNNIGSRMLLTATGYADNLHMQWDAVRGPEDQASSVSANWGEFPSLLEGIDATVSLTLSSGVLTVWTLDESGQRTSEIPVGYSGQQAIFNISRCDESPWYELIIENE